MMSCGINVNTFSIAQIPITILTEEPIHITEAFLPFLVEERTDEIVVEIHKNEMPDIENKSPVFSNIIFSVYEDEDGFYRVFHDHREGDKPYAIGRIYSPSYEKICYAKGNSGFFSESQNCFSHIALEELLLSRNAMILHASFVSTVYGGLLFSGPSGIGKSTQADLWMAHCGAELINGDRTILKKEDGWKAYGSPYAGSSRCFKNKSSKIRAIIVLEQSKQCTIERLQPSIAFGKLYAGMIVNTWNKQYIEKISRLIIELVKDIPIYQLACTPDITAVDMLKNVLENSKV